MDTAVALDVVDDGVGFAPDAIPPDGTGDGGFGLPAMRSRAESLGGTFTVESSPGQGTAVAITLPYPATGTPAHTAAGSHARVGAGSHAHAASGNPPQTGAGSREHLGDRGHAPSAVGGPAHPAAGSRA